MPSKIRLRTSLRVATFHARSYGFRTGRAAHDAQKILFLNLKSDIGGKEKRVIELDIEKCFDRIAHTSIMERLIAPRGLKLGIYRCLKAGVNPEYPELGTPQGGVVSPMLANIALNGIESVHKSKDAWVRGTEPSIRYADDMVIILRPEDDAEVILNKISQFLAERGMKVSEKKTKREPRRQMGLTFWDGTSRYKVTESLDVSLQWITSKLSDRR